MRIQTRLFLGTATLVLTLTATQWWLHRRQLAAIEREISVVATAVGKEILEDHVEVLVHRLSTESRETQAMVWMDDGSVTSGAAPGAETSAEIEVVAIPGSDGGGHQVRRVDRVLRLPGDDADSTTDAAASDRGGGEQAPSSGEQTDHEGEEPSSPVDAGNRIQLQVMTVGEPDARYLVFTNSAGSERRIPIPVRPTQRIVRETSNQGLAIGAGLLLVGLAASAMLASRLTRPLRGLAAGAEAVGRGELGVQVREDAAGEVGELQRAFNRMSSRLELLESERKRWLERENLAQLGDLSRGLAHTVRNPLNTLGLAVEELARDRTDEANLVATARAQIRRIDRWLRSFLALAAGEAADEETIDLRALVSDVTLQAIQDGASIELQMPDDELPVKGVPTALRAAIANLVENAIDASPDGRAVEVELRREDGSAVVAVTDHGPGLPEEVRSKLYSPHLTTKTGGSGMGLFLARQLVVGMHGGRLVMTDGPADGTVAEVRLQLDDGYDET